MLSIVELLQYGVPLIALLFTIGNALYTRKATRSRADAAKVERLEAEAQALRERVRVVETTLAGQPTRDELAAIHVSLAEIRGDLKAMTTGMTGFQELAALTRRQVDRMEEYLRSVPARPARS